MPVKGSGSGLFVDKNEKAKKRKIKKAEEALLAVQGPNNLLTMLKKQKLASQSVDSMNQASPSVSVSSTHPVASASVSPAVPGPSSTTPASASSCATATATGTTAQLTEGGHNHLR